MSKQKLSKNILYLSIVQIANYVLPIAFVPIISRIIGPEKFGIIDFSSSFVVYFALIINYGFDFSATRRIAHDITDQENNSKVFSLVFFSQMLLFFISCILFGILIFTVPQLYAEINVACFSFLICIASVFMQNWFFQAMQDLQIVAILNFVTKLLFVCTVLLVVRQKSDYVWQPLVASGSQIIIGLISFYIAIKKYKLKIVKTSLKDCIKILKGESTVFFSIIIVNLYTTTNVVILGFFHSHTQVGYFTSGQKLILIAQSIIVMPLMQALYPFIGGMFKTNKEAALEVIQKLVPIILIVTGICGIGIIILGPLAISIFYGDAFEPAVNAFRIMAFIPLCVAINYFLGIIVMLNLQMDKLYFKITAYAALISLVLNFVFIGKYGYLGSSVIWLTAEAFISIGMYYVLKINKVDVINLKYWTFDSIKTYLMPLKSKLLKNKI
jgi:O-antigen/teichoic acid export membrane protein